MEKLARTLVSSAAAIAICTLSASMSQDESPVRDARPRPASNPYEQLAPFFFMEIDLRPVPLGTFQDAKRGKASSWISSKLDDWVCRCG